MNKRFAGDLTQVWPLKFMFYFIWTISVALITYTKLKHGFWGNMKVLLGHLDWTLGTKGPHSDSADKTFLGLHIVSNVSYWSNLLLKMGWKLLSPAPVLRSFRLTSLQVATLLKTNFSQNLSKVFVNFWKISEIEVLFSKL